MYNRYIIENLFSSRYTYRLVGNQKHETFQSHDILCFMIINILTFIFLPPNKSKFKCLYKDAQNILSSRDFFIPKNTIIIIMVRPLKSFLYIWHTYYFLGVDELENWHPL